MSGTTFTYPMAKRIVSSTKWTEQQRGIIPEIETPIILNGNQDLLVRTSSTLPVGYTGAMAVQGEIVEQNQNGTYLPQMPIWIRDQNGGMLNSDTIYQARIGGTWTQDVTTNGIVKPTTLGLYLVQAGGAGERILYLQPWRYDAISADLADGTKTYIHCVILAEDNPDTTDAEIFTETSYFDYFALSGISTLDYPRTEFKTRGLWTIYEVNGKRTFSLKEIEQSPKGIWRSCQQGFICKYSEFYSLKDYDGSLYPTGNKNHIGNSFTFTRRVKKNSDGTPSVVNVKMHAVNQNVAFKPFLTFADVIDSYYNIVTTYPASTTSNARWGLSQTISFKSQGPDGAMGDAATGPLVQMKMYCQDPFGVG